MADKQNVGGIEVTADVNLEPLNEKLGQLNEILQKLDKRKFTVTGDLKGQFFKDLDSAIQKLAAGAKAPVQLDAAQNAAGKLQEQINKINNLEAKVSSFEVANDAAASIQAYLDSQKFVAKISKFEIDENSLAEQIQAALTGRKFKLDVDIGEVTGTVTPGKGATAAERAAAATPAQPAKPAPAAAAAQAAAQAAGIDPAKIADAIAKALSAASSGSAPGAKSAAAKTEAARGTSNAVSPTAFGLRADATPAATWAARTNAPIKYVGIGKERYDLPRPTGPSEPRGFRFTKAMAAARPDIAMVLADAGVEPGKWAPKEAAFQVGSILLQEQESEAKDAVLRAIYESAMDPYNVGGGAAGLKTMGDRVVRRGFHGRRPTPRGTGAVPKFGGRADLGGRTLTEPSVIGPALRSRMPTPRTAWHAAEGVRYDDEFIEKVTGLIQGTGGAEANWQQAREELRPRMNRLVEDVVSSGRNPREFFAGIRRSLGNQIQEQGKIQDIGPEMGPLELEAITLTGLYNALRNASETRTGSRVSKRGGRYGIAGSPMGVHETGIVTPGWIPRALTEAAASEERFQASPKATSGRAVARKAKSTRRKALGALGARVAEKGTDKRPETELISARGKLFKRLFEGEAYKRVEELRNLESVTATAAVETYGIASGQEEVDPAIEDMLRNEARKQFIAALPEDEADLYIKAQGIPMTDEEAQNWRANEAGRAATVGAEAAAFDERHGKKPRARRAATPAAEPTPAGTVTDLNEYRAFRKKGGGIGWRGPGGFVAQKNVPAERVAEEIQRIGGTPSGAGRDRVPPGEVTARGGGGGVQRVHVVNFGDLGRLLSGTTNIGGLKKGIGMDFKGIIDQARAKGVDPVDTLVGLKIPKKEAQEAVAAVDAASGAVAPSVWPTLKIERSAGIARTGRERGEAQIQANVQKGIAAYNAAYVPPAPRNERQEMYSKLWAQADKEMDTKSARESARMQRAAEAQVKRITEAPKPAAAPKPKPGPKVRDIDNPEDDLLKYASRRGYAIAPTMGPADRRALAQQEIAQTYGQFNLQRQMMPERAPGVAFAQVFARLTGVKGRMERAAEARSAAESELLTAKDLRIADEGRLARVKQIRRAIEESRATQSAEMTNAKMSSREIAAALSEQTRHRREAIAKEKELTKQVDARKTSEAEATEKLKLTDSALASAGGKMASFAQIGALFVGAKAFMIFNQALDTTVKLAADVGARSVDQLLGFQATNDKVTKSLRDQIRAFNGNTTAAMGQTAAMAGLSDAAAEYVKNATIGNALATAGAQARMQASDLFRAASYQETRQGGQYQGFARGLFEGQGGVLGGPLFAEQMGGTPGMLERIRDDLKYFTEGITNANKAGMPVAAWSPLTPPQEMTPQQTQQWQGLNPNPAMTNAYLTQMPIIPGEKFGETKIAQMQGPPIEAFIFSKERKAYITDLNATMGRGADRLGERLTASFKEFGTSADKIPKNIADAMDAAGASLGGAAQQQLRDLKEAGIGIEGIQGMTPWEQGKAIGKAMESLAQGQVTPDQRQYLNITKQQLTAQIQGNEMMRKLQTGLVMPAQVALERLMNPPTPIAAGTAEMAAAIPTTGPMPVKGVPNFSAQIAAVQQLQDANQKLADRSKVLRIIAPEDKDAASGLLTVLEEIGQSMARINTQSAQLQGALAAAQYANQRRIMVRDLQDALALGAKRYDAEVGTLGAMQRQQVMLDRQNQALSLQAQQMSIMLAQRQINFQKAVAGFQAPGVTAEERSARIKQAKIEAEYAQKQLDIQKKQATIAQKSYKLNIRIFDETVKRQIEDLTKGLGLLDKSYVTNVSLQLNEKKLAELDKKRQTIAQTLSGYIQKGIENQNAYVGAAISAAATITGSVNTWYAKITGYSVKFMEGFAEWIGSGGTSIPNFGKKGGAIPGHTLAETIALEKKYNEDLNNNNIIGKAQGGLFNTTGVTGPMVVGEAGTETVAILRNPRQTTATPMGGGGQTITIMITGNSVRDDRDLDLLTDRIERKLNMKASLLGYRRPV